MSSWVFSMTSMKTPNLLDFGELFGWLPEENISRELPDMGSPPATGQLIRQSQGSSNLFMIFSIVMSF